MKHQYFGDVNDYRKYGLLRRLQSDSGLRLGVCWMLTADDSRTDGKFVDYLARPARWRGYDPELFDSLATAVGVSRHIGHARADGILGDVVCVDAAVPDHRQERRAFFTTAHRALGGVDLVFFDPDNGIEIPSCPSGRKNSSKYVMKSEIAATFAGGQSVLVYQHFIREERSGFLARLCSELQSLTGTGRVYCFRTARVAFLLLPQDGHEARIGNAANAIGQLWADQVQVTVCGSA